jgi:hypothetical protein
MPIKSNNGSGIPTFYSDNAIYKAFKIRVDAYLKYVIESILHNNK